MEKRAEITESYETATPSVYNAHFNLQNQRIVNTDIDECYKVINEDFKDFYLVNTRNGITSYGLPWRVTLENGKIGPASYQAGFVGQQIPCAYNMMLYGIKNKEITIENGAKSYDFLRGYIDSELGQLGGVSYGDMLTHDDLIAAATNAYST